MPLYDYHCTACNHRCELLEKMNAAPSTECPACHQPHLQRQVSAPQFQLKGSGWYVTDFKPGAKKPTQEASQETPKETAKSTETPPKTESTPASAKTSSEDAT